MPQTFSLLPVFRPVLSKGASKAKIVWHLSMLLFALGKEAEFTVSKLAAHRVAKIRTFSDCQIDVLHVIIWEKYLNLCKLVIKIMDEKVKKSRGEVCCVVGCGNNKKNSPDRIFYSFSTKNHKLEQREKWIKAVRRSKLVIENYNTFIRN